LKVGVFQFSASNDIKKNFKIMTDAIVSAKNENVRLLVFQECAACGYPPVETDNIDNMDFDVIKEEMGKIARLARRYGMYIAVGTIRQENCKYYNSIQLINPEGEFVSSYDKRALWGWDSDNFEKGSDMGIYQIDNIKVGFRICFEVRFPEYFRELFLEGVSLCFVSFCDVSEMDSAERYNIIKSHLITRAVENVMSIISVNSISKFQTAPTAVIDHNGRIIAEATKNQNYLLLYDYEPAEITFGMNGRLKHSIELLSTNTDVHK